MTKMHLIARIILTVLGVYLVVQLLDNAPMFLQSTMQSPFSFDNSARILIFLLFLASGFAIIYYLLFTPDRLVQKMIGSTEDITDFADPIWIATAFRLALVLFGILITARNIDFIVNTAAFLIYGPKLIVEMIVYKYIDKTFDMPLCAWLTIVARLLKTALGIYLLFGAPQYVRWQIEKSHTQAGPANLGTQTDSV
jgi:hypothetical protein